MGIGGVPSREFAFRLDVPTLPELVRAGETLRGAQPSSWPWFVEQLRSRGASFAKVQVPGPASGLRDAREQAVTYARELIELGVQPMVFIDEPMLSAGALVSDVLPLRDAMREVGAIVGLHCCGNADWTQVFEADFDVVSFDARLSLNAVLEHRRRITGWLALGVVPTTPGVQFDIDALCGDVKAADAMSLCDRMLLTPACGLGLVDSAHAVVEQLHRAQARFRRLMGEPT